MNVYHTDEPITGCSIYYIFLRKNRTYKSNGFRTKNKLTLIQLNEKLTYLNYLKISQKNIGIIPFMLCAVVGEC